MKHRKEPPKLTVQTDANVVDEPIVDALCLTDSMPFYSNLYPERLVVQNATDGTVATAAQPSPLRISVLKQLLSNVVNACQKQADQQIVMDKPDFSLTVDVFRNLSPSNSVPDLFVLLRLHDVSFCFTTEFYKLLRGCLDYNLGELLIPQPETIPVELLEVPEEIGVGLGENHLVFTLRIILKKVQVGWCWLVAEVYREGF
uniref:Uncharacterized protein n=1 Tax=Globodera pallida TaxID=36090 RepID=A0A183C0Q1_GLOPA